MKYYAVQVAKLLALLATAGCILVLVFSNLYGSSLEYVTWQRVQPTFERLRIVQNWRLFTVNISNWDLRTVAISDSSEVSFPEEFAVTDPPPWVSTSRQILFNTIGNSTRASLNPSMLGSICRTLNSRNGNTTKTVAVQWGRGELPTPAWPSMQQRLDYYQVAEQRCK